MYNSQFSLYGINALNTLSIDEILIYLRKSRQDDPNETVEEVLHRHEMQLQDYSMRVWGAKIPEENIYREVVSGETIDDRPEINKVLDRVQDSKIKAVLVIEAPRLTRGDLLDLGTMVHALRYTHTLCVTPDRVYNLENKHDRRAFEDELKRGNDYLEYTKEILARGRRLSAMQGYWVPTKPPYGYDKEQQKNKKFILVPNENAAYVRMIFEWYAAGENIRKITRLLWETGARPSLNKIKWSKSSIQHILKNDAYIGIVRYGESRMIRIYEGGKLKKKRVAAPESEHIVAKGLHDPIIPLDLWERVQERLGNVDRTNTNNQLANPVAGLLFCKKCGFALRRKINPHYGYIRFICTMSPQCDTKSVLFGELLSALQGALRANVEEIEEKIASGAESAAEARAAQLAALEEKFRKLQDQEDHQYDLLERREYTPEVFNRRHSKLVKEMESVKSAIEEARATMPETIDYEDALIRLHDAIDALDSDDMCTVEKNMILKSIIDRIEYTREKGSTNNPFEIDVHLKL